MFRRYRLRQFVHHAGGIEHAPDECQPARDVRLVSPVHDPERVIDRGRVILDRAQADIQPVCDLLVRQSLSV